MRTRTTIAAVAGLAAAGLIFAATPAQAAGSYTTNCDAPLTVTGTPGDEVTFTFGPRCSDNYWYVWNLNGTYDSGDYDESGFLDFGTATPSPASGYFYPTYYYDNDWYLYNTYDGTPTQSFTATIRATDGAGNPIRYGSTMASISFYYSPYQSYAITYGGAGEAEGTPIPDVIQQVALPASGSCDTVDDKALNWGGVKSGGWTKSWAEWADGGTGGSVCTRTLHYDNGWTVAA